MLRNPLSRLDRQRRQHESDWMKYASSEDLALLIELHDAPQTRETLELLIEIWARAERKRQVQAQSVVPAGNALAGTDLKAWVLQRWGTASDATRATLRRIAAASGIELPMRRTRPAPVEQPALPAPEPTQPASIDEASIGDHGRFGKPQSADTTPATPADDYWTRGEGAWTSCESLYDALHSENIGWE